MPFDNEHICTIRLHKESMKFSAAHFTIFSATERERLHGHNFQVQVDICAPTSDNGMLVNYQQLKKHARQCCKQLDEYLILPELSPHLVIKSEDNHYQVTFNQETLLFSKFDTLLLPIRNTTVEEFSRYFLQQLLSIFRDQLTLDIHKLAVHVSSAPGQSGSSEWIKTSAI